MDLNWKMTCMHSALRTVAVSEIVRVSITFDEELTRYGYI